MVGIPKTQDAIFGGYFLLTKKYQWPALLFRQGKSMADRRQSGRTVFDLNKKIGVIPAG